jgi:TIGR04002 family protein
MKTEQQKLIQNIVKTALFAAIILAVTGYLPRIPVAGGAGGYIHLGDVIIYIAASILPTQYACIAGALGAGLADAMTGFAIWSPATMIVKALMAVMFTPKSAKTLPVRNIIAVLPAGIICVVGYYLYECLLTSSFTVPLVSVPFNLIQAGLSAVIYIIFAFALDKINIKSKIERGFNDERF